MKGLLVVNKKKGVSSSSVVVKIKKMLGTKKVGHMGTLDPLASGVLLIGVGKATRLFQSFLNNKKRYLATFKFGKETDTLDLEGAVVKTSNIIPTLEQINQVLNSFVGVQNQMPPKYSSKKVDGKRAYDLVRSGKDFELKPNKIEIYNISFVKQLDDNTFVFDISCSAGTYIRSIARDMGEKLNSCATMVDLVRTQCGDCKLDNAITIDLESPQSITQKIVSLKEVLKHHKQIEINKQQLEDLLNGKKVKIDKFKNQKECCLMFEQDVVGICDFNENGIIKITTFLYN